MVGTIEDHPRPSRHSARWLTKRGVPHCQRSPLSLRRRRGLNYPPTAPHPDASHERPSSVLSVPHSGNGVGNWLPL